MELGFIKGLELDSDAVKNWWQVLIGSGLRFDYVLKITAERKLQVFVGVPSSGQSLFESLLKTNFKNIFISNPQFPENPKAGMSWGVKLEEINEGQSCDWSTLVDIFVKFAKPNTWVSVRQGGFNKSIKISCSLRNKRWLKSYWNVVFQKFKFTFLLSPSISKEDFISSNAFPWPSLEKESLHNLQEKIWFFEKNTPITDGVNLGTVRKSYVSDPNKFHINQKDRMRHMYILGKTGVGKSTLMYNMFMQDVEAGNGCCIVDPHGDLVEEILKNFPKNRVNDLVILDPTDLTFPFAFNILDSSLIDSKDLVVAGVIDVFKKLYGFSWGPRMEYILRNALMVLVEAKGQTLLSLQRFLVEEDFRRQLVKQVQDPIVKKFWEEEFAALDKKSKTEFVAPILNKVGQFMSVSYIRNILGQVKSKVDFFWMMNKQKVVLIKLPKGQLGEENATLLGSMMLTFLQLQVMRRQSLASEDRKSFYLYVDEFQNFATSSFEVLLSEARKYGLGLIVANQFLSQLEESIREALLGNVGTLLSFRLGLKDAELISKYLGGDVHVDNLLDMPKFKALIKTLIDGEVAPVFTLFCDQPFVLHENKAEIEKILRAVRDRYTSQKDKVEEKIGRFVKTDSQD